MTEPAWTKGPWRAHPTNKHDVVDQSGNILARAMLYDSTDIPREATFANTILMASALDLYSALEALVRAVNTNELAAAMACHSVVSFANVEDALTPAIEALRKARGEQS